MILAAALPASGCDATVRSEGRVALGLATDSAYLTVLSEQNDNAVAYSETILKTSPSSQIEKFANNVIKTRAEEANQIKQLQAKDSQHYDFTLPDAAAQLGRSLEHLGITKDGKPLAAPSTEQGYIAAMTANAKSVLRASNVETEHGSPGVVPFAKDVILERTDELEQLRNF